MTLRECIIKACCAFALLAPQAHAQNVDGNDWLALEEPVRAVFVRAYREGFNKGVEEASYQSHTKYVCDEFLLDDDASKRWTPCQNEARNQLDKHKMARADVEGVHAALNDYYADERNRDIPVNILIPIAMHSLAGRKPAVIKHLIKTAREYQATR